MSSKLLKNIYFINLHFPNVFLNPWLIRSVRSDTIPCSKCVPLRSVLIINFSSNQVPYKCASINRKTLTSFHLTTTHSNPLTLREGQAERHTVENRAWQTHINNEEQIGVMANWMLPTKPAFWQGTRVRGYKWNPSPPCVFVTKQSFHWSFNSTR